MRALLLVSLLVAAPALAADPTCKVTATGGFTVTTPCSVSFLPLGEAVLGIGTKDTKVPAVHLDVTFASPPAAGAYGFETVTKAYASGADPAQRGTLWELNRGGPIVVNGEVVGQARRKGELKLELTAVGKHARDFHGKATLVLEASALGKGPTPRPLSVQIEF